MRAFVAAELHRLLAVGRRSDDAEVLLGAEQRREPGADDLLVVDDRDLDRHAAASGDRQHAPRPRTRRRPPARRVSVPPTMIARSRIPSRPCPSRSGEGGARPVVANAEAQRVGLVLELDLHRCSRCMPADVRERLLQDPVRAQVDAGRQRRHRALERERHG